MKPDEALDLQVDLVKFWGSRTGQEYGRNFFSDLFSKSVIGHESHGDLEPAIESATQQAEFVQLARNMAEVLDRADTFVVTKEMVELITHAARGLDQSEYLLHLDIYAPPEMDLPYGGTVTPYCPEGFVVLEKPLIVRDANKRRMSISAFSWWYQEVIFRKVGTDKEKIEGDALFVSYYTHRDDPEDEFNERLMADPTSILNTTSSKLHLSHVDIWFNQERLYTTESGLPEPPQGTSWRERLWLAALWMISAQRLTYRERFHAHRATLRRIERSGMKLTGDILVISLRTRKEPHRDPQEPQVVAWSHRWIVRGHWRNQWVPSLGTHRPTYIASYVKGPEDRPLIVKDSVFVVRR